MRTVQATTSLLALTAYGSEKNTESLRSVEFIGCSLCSTPSCNVGALEGGPTAASLVAVFPRGGDSGNKSGEGSKGQKERSKKKKTGSRKGNTSTTRGKTNSEKSDLGMSSSNGVADEDAKADNRSNIIEDILKHDDLYQVLGVSENASSNEITKAYRRRAVQTHPDKTGGDRRAFDKVSEAYEVLSDEGKRELYNRFGKEGLDETRGMGTPSSYQDLFRNMFQQQAQARARQNHTARYQLQVSLEDLYNGMIHDVEIGSPYARDRQKKVQVHIPKGSLSGQKIILSGEMDFATTDTPGDIIFILSQKPHPVFTRKGNDLAMELSITLEEALCGFHRRIQHLNGRELWIQSALVDDKPVIIQTGDVQVLHGEGMPKQGQSDEYGDMYIQFRVEMPRTKKKSVLTDEEMKELSRLLTKLSEPSAKKHRLENVLGEQSHRLKAASISDFGRASGPTALDPEDNIHDDHGDEFRSFSSSFFGNGPTRGSFYFGGSSFGADSYGEDGSDVQCKQM